MTPVCLSVCLSVPHVPLLPPRHPLPTKTPFLDHQPMEAGARRGVLSVVEDTANGTVSHRNRTHLLGPPCTTQTDGGGTWSHLPSRQPRPHRPPAAVACVCTSDLESDGAGFRHCSFPRVPSGKSLGLPETGSVRLYSGFTTPTSQEYCENGVRCLCKCLVT